MRRQFFGRAKSRIAACAAVAAMVGGLVAMGGQTPASAATCPADVFFIGARGSGEAAGSTGMGDVVGQFFDRAKSTLGSRGISVKPMGVDYPARSLLSVATLRYDSSFIAGVEAVKSDLRRAGEIMGRPECATARLVVAGYSQGAMAVHLALLETAESRDPDIERALGRMSAAVLMADGFKLASDERTKKFGRGSFSSRNGVSVPNGFAKFPASIAAKIYDVCAWGDAVCDPTVITNVLIGGPIHASSYRVGAGADPIQGAANDALNDLTVRVTVDVRKARADNAKSPVRPSDTLVPSTPNQPKPIRTNPSDPAWPVYDCIVQAPRLSDGDCISGMLYVGEEQQEQQIVQYLRDWVYTVDEASVPELTSYGFRFSEDRTRSSVSVTKSGVFVVKVNGVGPDGSTVSYYVQFDIVESADDPRYVAWKETQLDAPTQLRNRALSGAPLIEVESVTPADAVTEEITVQEAESISTDIETADPPSTTENEKVPTSAPTGPEVPPVLRNDDRDASLSKTEGSPTPDG